jgi:hypothetical protein
MTDEHLCLSDMLDQDLTAYELFHSLPKDLQQEIIREDISSFYDLQNYLEVRTGRRPGRGGAGSEPQTGALIG